MYKSIVICGIDGSGKTTVANSLRKILSKKSRVIIIWFRWRALLTYALYLYSNIMHQYKRIFNPRLGRHIKVSDWSRDVFLRKFYPYILLFDMLIFYFLIKVKLFFSKPRIVIFDRFFIDALLDVVYETMNPKVLKSVPAYITFALARKADKCVFLDVDPRIAYERKKDIISMGELKYKQTFYRYIAKVMGFSIIDTSNYKVENVVNNILELCQDLHL